MNPLATFKCWLAKLGVVKEKPALQQLEELVEQAAIAGRSGRRQKYYTRPHGKYADFKDFDTDRMIRDFSAAFPSIPEDEVRRVVMQGLYYHYLR